MTTFFVPGIPAPGDHPPHDAPQPDHGRALSALRGILGAEHDPERIVYLCCDGAPSSKARARFNMRTGRAYTPAKTAAAEAALALRLKSVLRGQPFTGNVAIVAFFYRPNHQRIDADNMMKMVMDAATKAGAWDDDCQVTAQASFVEFDPDRPRTVIALCDARSSMQRGDIGIVCEGCGKAFTRARREWRGQRFCSANCGRKSELAEAKCPRCDGVFQRKRAGQRYCSKGCAHSRPLIRPPDSKRRPAPTCQQCGGRVSRREYTRCANCAPKGRKIGSKNRPKGVE